MKSRIFSDAITHVLQQTDPVVQRLISRTMHSIVTSCSVKVFISHMRHVYHTPTTMRKLYEEFMLQQVDSASLNHLPTNIHRLPSFSLYVHPFISCHARASSLRSCPVSMSAFWVSPFTANILTETDVKARILSLSLV